MSRPKRPKVLPNKLPQWTARHYDKAADAVMDAIGLTVREWADVRYAIRLALEGHLSKAPKEPT